MTTTLQQIQDRAVAFSSANGLSSLVSDRAEIINRIAGFERDVYDLAARENRYFFAVSAGVSSTNGSSGRTIALSSLTALCGRILKFVLNDGRTVDQVDVQDLNAELAPRYYVLGTTIYEVSNDWSPNTGVVSGTLTYVRLPSSLSVTGDLTQTVTLPDDFCDMLEVRLAYYLAHKDVGRDPAELERLAKMIAEQDENFISHITEFAGVESQRFNIPARGDKK
jgi:hypothetical protein